MNRVLPCNWVSFANSPRRAQIALGAVAMIILCGATIVPRVLAAPSTAKELTNSIGMKLTLIPAGEFTMGASADDVAEQQQTKERNRKQTKKKQAEPDDDETPDELTGTAALIASQSPPHRVTISKPFHLGTHEVTQSEFQAVMGFNPSSHATTGSHPRPVKGIDTKRHPVENVTWDDAAEFCRQLSSLPAEVSAGRTYRLPTEAEWEYAYRAGTTTPYYWGERTDDMRDELVTKKEEGKIRKAPQPVGMHKPNPWGLYDMAGNVREWCGDWYGAKTYERTAARDPTGPANGDERVVRGANVVWQVMSLRSSYRFKEAPATSHCFRGFRVVCESRSTVAPESAPPTLAQLDADLRKHGLQRQGTFFVLPEEAEFTRFVSTLERMRAACFVAAREVSDAQARLKQADSAKAATLVNRADARTSINYSDTWRERWLSIRARNAAHDQLMAINLSRSGIETWLADAQADYDSAVKRFAEQCRTLRENYAQLQAKQSQISQNSALQTVLAAANSGGKAAYHLGPAPALTAAVKKLAHEESMLQQLGKQ